MEAVQDVKEKDMNVNEIRGINRQTFAQKMKAYKRQPLS